MVRGYGCWQGMVCYGGGVSTHKLYKGELQWGQVMVRGGRYVRERESEFIGTYQNLSEEIGGNRMGSDKL